MGDRVTAQPILTPLTEAAIFLVVTVDSSAGALATARELLSDVAPLSRSVGFRAPEGVLTCVVGIGSSMWGRLFSAPRPVGLHPFRELAGTRHTAVSTPGDLLFHIRSRRMDLCFELAGQLMNELGGWARVVDEVHGFRYFDERDLLGFVDGTENPAGAAAFDAAIIGDKEPQFAGGSYVIVQKYLHDLDTWNALSVEEQERVVGRAKLSDIELPDDVKPANSHVALNTINDENGEQRQIMRFNMAFGTLGVGEFGTYFIGYSSDPDVTEQMLTNMFIGNPPGNYDRILDFSRAVTGSLFFVPTSDFLDDPPDPARQAAGAGDSDGHSDGVGDPAADHSLGIGDLRA